MPQFPKDHVFILPHAEKYRRLYGISMAQVFSCLNEPDVQEGLAEDHYTVEKSFHDQRVYVYYYLTLPLQGKKDEAYIIVDFMGYTLEEDQAQEAKPGGKRTSADSDTRKNHLFVSGTNHSTQER